jgi:hypothetical protein
MAEPRRRDAGVRWRETGQMRNPTAKSGKREEKTSPKPLNPQRLLRFASFIA